MLYHVQQQHIMILQQIADLDGEITPEIEQALELNKQELQEAGLSIGHLLLYLQGQEDAVKKELERLTKLKQKIGKTYELFKGKLSEAMVMHEVERIDSPTLSLFFRKAKAVEIIDESDIPEDYFDIPAPVVSKARIKKALTDGLDVKGAELVERKHLQIK